MAQRGMTKAFIIWSNIQRAGESPLSMFGKSLRLSVPFWRALTLGIVLFCFLTRPAMSADPMAPEVDKVLRSMSTFMESLSGFSVEVDVDNEIIDLTGQKLQFSSSGEIVFKRPDKLHVKRQGAIADVELLYDGKVLTLYGRNLNVYFQHEAPGTTDDALDAIWNVLGFNAPGADLFYTDAHKELSEGVASSSYLGTAYVNGVECHHLAFREASVDWQLWIDAEGDPLPMKYVITTKWMTGAPQFAIRFDIWNTSPEIDSGRFDFKAPEGAVKLETVSVDELGKIVLEEKK